MAINSTHLITVRFKKTGNGQVAATSEDLPGLYLTYPNREQIVADLPEAIKLLYKANYGQDVTVLLVNSPTEPDILKEDRQTLAAIPLEVLRNLQLANS